MLPDGHFNEWAQHGAQRGDAFAMVTVKKQDALKA